MTTDGSTFDEYWAAFVRAHAAPSLRRLSFVAMSAGLATATVFLFTRRTLLLVLAPVVAFAPPLMVRKLAGESSLAAEHPLFFAAASLKMWRLTLSGAMEAEVGRATAMDTPFSSAERDGGDGGDAYPRPNMVTDHTLH